MSTTTEALSREINGYLPIFDVLMRQGLALVMHINHSNELVDVMFTYDSDCFYIKCIEKGKRMYNITLPIDLIDCVIKDRELKHFTFAPGPIGMEVELRGEKLICSRIYPDMPAAKHNDLLYLSEIYMVNQKKVFTLVDFKYECVTERRRNKELDVIISVLVNSVNKGSTLYNTDVIFSILTKDTAHSCIILEARSKVERDTTVKCISKYIELAYE